MSLTILLSINFSYKSNHILELNEGEHIQLDYRRGAIRVFRIPKSVSETYNSFREYYRCTVDLEDLPLASKANYDYEITSDTRVMVFDVNAYALITDTSEYTTVIERTEDQVTYLVREQAHLKVEL